MSGALLGAIGAAFVVVGSVLAFDQWPANLVDAPTRSIEVASASGSGSAPPAPAVIALPPAAVPAAPSAPSPGDGPGGQGRDPGGPGPRATPPTDGVPVPVAPPTPVPPVDGDPAPAAQPENALATAVESTTGATAETVRSVGTALPLTAPVADLVGGVVDGAGRSVGELLRDLGGE